MQPTSIVLWGLGLAIFSLCAWDVILDVGGSNQWTISYNLLSVEVANPWFGLGLIFTLSSLVGHLCLAHIGPDLTGWKLWARMGIGLAPILATFVLLVAGRHATDIPQAAGAFAEFNLRHGVILWIVSGLGLLNGAYMVPQHP
jgi:hypothetical protein